MEYSQSSAYLVDSSPDTDDTESDTESSSCSEHYFSADSEPSSPSPNSGSSSLTHSESTDSTYFSSPDSALDSVSSNLTFFGEWVDLSADSGPSHDRSHYQSHDQRDALRAHVCYNFPPTTESHDQSHDQRDALHAHLECNICHNTPPTHPVATHCGHIFCSPCLYQYLQDRPKPCPVCRTIIETGSDTVLIYCSTSDPSDDNHDAFCSCHHAPTPQFPPGFQLRKSLTTIVTETERLHVEQMQNCESMREHLEALTEELGALHALGSHIVRGHGSTAVCVMESTRARIRELIVRTGDWMRESQRVRWLLDDIEPDEDGESDCEHEGFWCRQTVTMPGCGHQEWKVPRKVWKRPL